MEQEVFKLYSKYYNLFYADKQYGSEVAYIDGLIKKFSPGAMSILEYGSGTGGHGLLLQKLGYRMMGIERSEEMARIAQEKGYPCEVADILEFQTDDTYDVCIALFHVISYINSNQDLIKLFSKTRKTLKQNGLFIFDVWYSPAVMYQKPEVRIKKVSDAEVQVTRLAQPVMDDLRNIVTVNYDVFIKNKADDKVFELFESHPMRHFSYPELDLLAQHTGFAIVKGEEFLTGAPATNKTWGVNFILQAK